MNPTISSHTLRGGASILAYNSNPSRLIAAGQQNFHLFSIDDNNQFHELHDFRNTRLQTQVSRWSVLQPKDVVWNLNNENCFATTSSTNGCLFIWDASRLSIVKQINLHQGIINRILFHPKEPNVLLSASQDGYAKLVDIRINEFDRLISSFRHSSKEAFRDIDINPSITDKFAALIHDQYSVPIWDIRQPNQIDSSVLTREKVLSIAWNPWERSWLATGGLGGHDRTIRIWDTKTTDNRQDALFTVYTYGQVSKLSWHPNEKYQIACFTRTLDYRIHIWDIRRAYLPQLSFCHHRNEIEDFLWQSNTDNIISIGRDERLIHAPLSSAIRSEDIVSLFSLNVTPKGSAHVTMPNLDSEYMQSQIAHRNSLNINDLYSYRTLQTNTEWSKPIRGNSLLIITKNCCRDRSIEEFHYLAKKWIFENRSKCLDVFSKICNENSHSAEEIHRYDLSATWQIINMLFTKSKISNHSTKTSRSLTKSRFLSDSLNNSRRKQTINIERYEENLDEKSPKTNSNLEIFDEFDSYIVRDVLSDDLLFLTPDDLINYQQYDELSDRDQIDFDAMYQLFIDNPTTKTNVTYINDDENLENEDEYDNLNSITQISTHSTIPDYCEQFFTIDESYCPTIQNRSINFDEIIRQTILYYIENNELQVAVHLLLVLCPKKRLELFQGSHMHWIMMYIELLQKMRLFVKAKQVMKDCIENEDMPLNYDPKEYDGSIFFQRSSVNLNNKQNSSTPKEFICTICQIPCRGLFTFCGVCFHGGHIDHIKNWFKTHDECPYGCGHRCADRDSQSRRNCTTQRLLSRSSIVFQ